MTRDENNRMLAQRDKALLKEKRRNQVISTTSNIQKTTDVIVKVGTGIITVTTMLLEIMNSKKKYPLTLILYK